MRGILAHSGERMCAPRGEVARPLPPGAPSVTAGRGDLIAQLSASIAPPEGGG
jgi:hypothetical protein